MDANYLDLIKDLLRSGEVESALKALHQAVEKGDGEACAFLGSLYLEGHYVKQDVGRAKAYFQQGVRLGDKSCADNVNATAIRVGKKGELIATKQNVRDLFRLAKKGYAEPLLMLCNALDRFPQFAKDHWLEIEGLFLNAIEQLPNRVELRMAYVYYAHSRVTERTDLIRIAEVLTPLLYKGPADAACLYLDLVFRNPKQLPEKWKLNAALKQARTSQPDIYYIASGYIHLLDCDGPAAFAVLSEGADKQIDMATIGLGYCYLHGIGTPKDLLKAKSLLLPLKDTHNCVPVYLARIEMLLDSEHPHLTQAMNYLDMAEDADYPYFYKELCSWLGWCKLRQVPLADVAFQRWVEIYDEGLRYNPDQLAELPMVKKLPLSKEAAWVIKKPSYYKRQTPTTPMGWFQKIQYSWDDHHQLTIHMMDNLVDCFILDWDVRCEWAIVDAIYTVRWWNATLSDPSWPLERAKRLSQGVYDVAIRQCEQLIALHLGYKQGDAAAAVSRFLTDYATHEGEPVAEYTYAWMVLRGLIEGVDESVCLDHIKRIRDWSLPCFYQLCADLLDGVERENAAAEGLKAELLEKGQAYMKRDYTARMLCAGTAMPFFIYDGN